MKYLKKTGMGNAIQELSRQDACVQIIGICGGYQMLGAEMRDDAGIESRERRVQGLGLLPVVTVFHKEKTLTQVCARERGSGTMVRGYEIHHGQTHAIERLPSVFTVTERLGRKVSYADGAMTADGRVWGTYLHGVFDADGFRRVFLNRLRRLKGLEPLALSSSSDDEKEFDKLAVIFRKNIRMKAVYGMLEGKV
jgi:adenosylcobyric acid synthase